MLKLAGKSVRGEKQEFLELGETVFRRQQWNGNNNV
jgi:hypothetical protein